MKFTIPNLVFIVLISLITIYLTFLTTKGDLTNNRGKLWKALTKRGKIVFFILILMSLVLITQEYNNKNLSDNSQFIIDSLQSKRNTDITAGIKKGVDSSNQKLFKDLSIALAKQNIKFDSLNKSFIRSKGLKEITNNFPQDAPVIFIDSNGIYFKKRIGFNNNYKIIIKSMNAGSTKHNIISYFLIQFKDGTYIVEKNNLFAKNIQISKDGSWITGFSVDAYKAIGTIYLFLKGSYSTLDESKKYNIEELYNYNTETQKVSIPISDRERIIQIINELSSVKK